MTTELATTEQKPAEVVLTGREAAVQLQKIVNSRPKKLVMGGKQYLFFEDWQTVGKFYGVTTKVTRTEELKEEGKLIGFLATAVAIANGVEISGADAECTSDELNWKGKPRFQLRSMAQTRACAKALRNCLGWVAVLAGYEPTPAEEMSEDTVRKPAKEQPQSDTSTTKSTPGTSQSEASQEESNPEIPAGGGSGLEPVGKIPTTIQELATWAGAKGKLYNPSWICRQLNIKALSEIRNVEDAYHELLEITGWEH